MEQPRFEKTKQQLKNSIDSLLLQSEDVAQQHVYEKALSILSSITYANRQANKGVLARYIVDSYFGDETVGTELMEFDKRM